jgi:hypothetical protein
MEKKDFDKKYSKIIKSMISEHFPELTGKKIFISEAGEWISKRCSAATIFFIFFSLIRVSRKLRTSPDREIESILAHELGHVLRFESVNFFQKLWKGLRYFTSISGRTEEENACDKIAIERGYARGLYAIKSSKKKRKKKHKYENCYLTKEQIKSYAKSIGKW